MITFDRNKRVLISACLENARYHIVLARQKLQEGQVVRDLVGQGDLVEECLAFSCTTEAMAKFHKSQAKSALCTAEKTAGQDFCTFGNAPLGAKNLDGKNFKGWTAYHQVFSNIGSPDRWSR